VAAEREQGISTPAHATGAVQCVAVDDIASDETFRLRADGDITQLAESLGRLGQLAPVELRRWPGAVGDGPRWQVVAGFRRLAAVHLLALERVLARVHDELADDGAWGLALSDALLHQPLTGDELVALRERFREKGVAPWAEGLVEDALVTSAVAADPRERFHDSPSAGEPPVPLAPQSGESVGERGLHPLPGPLPSRERDPGSGSLARPPEDGVDVIEVTPEDLVQELAIRLSALNQDLAMAVEAWKDLPSDGRKVLVEQARYVSALLPFMEGEE
jgi:hypothetical protein